MSSSSRLLAGPLGLASVLCHATMSLAQDPQVAEATDTEPSPADPSTPGPGAAPEQSEAAPAPAPAQPVAPPAGDAAASAPASEPAGTAPVPAAPAPPGPAHHATQQSQAPSVQTTPTDSLSTPLAPEGPPGREHDGFYLRLALGAGTGTVEFGDAPPQLGDAMEGTGWLDVMIGGTPGRGLVVGGGMWAGGFDTSEWRGENNERGSVVMFAMGPFIDYFPDPSGGFHFGGTVALGVLSVDAEPFSNPDERTAADGALGAWMGYDFWVSREISLGVEARYVGVRAKHPDNDWQGRAEAFGLSFTGLYH